MKSAKQQAIRLLIILSFVLRGSYISAQINYGNNKAAGHYKQVRNVKLYYEIYGHGKPLLLLHGNGESIQSMYKQIDAFKNERMVIAVDARGHGKSSDPGEGFTYQMLADDMGILLDSLKLNKVDVFGWSDGAILALLLARDHDKRLDKVVAFAANIYAFDEQVADPRLVRGLKRLYASLPDSSADQKRAKEILSMVFADPVIPDSSLHTIKVPVLVATADHDGILLEHSVSIYRNIKNAQFAVLNNASHFAPWEDAQRINTLIREFINKPFKEKPLVPKEYSFLIEE